MNNKIKRKKYGRNMEEIYKELLNKVNKENMYLNEPMYKHTTFRIGGTADLFIKVQTIEELTYIIKTCNRKEIPLTVIGNGSNILVQDRWN